MKKHKIGIDYGTCPEKICRPIPENVAAYEKHYADYCRLYDYFGRGENDVMKRLRHVDA